MNGLLQGFVPLKVAAGMMSISSDTLRRRIKKVERGTAPPSTVPRFSKYFNQYILRSADIERWVILEIERGSGK